MSRQSHRRLKLSHHVTPNSITFTLSVHCPLCRCAKRLRKKPEVKRIFTLKRPTDAFDVRSLKRIIWDMSASQRFHLV